MEAIADGTMKGKGRTRVGEAEEILCEKEQKRKPGGKKEEKKRKKIFQGGGELVYICFEIFFFFLVPHPSLRAPPRPAIGQRTALRQQEGTSREVPP